MTSIEVGGGQLTITDETILIDIGPFGALKRLYEQSRLIVALLSVCLLLVVGMSIFGSSPLREFALFAIVFVIVGPMLTIITSKIMNNIETAAKIRRSTVDEIEYTAGGRFRLPKLRIIATDGEETGARSVPLSHRRLGGDQQLEYALQAFEEAGISVTSIDDPSDNDRSQPQ